MLAFSARPSFASGLRCRADTPSSPGWRLRLSVCAFIRSGLRSSWRYWFPVQPAERIKIEFVSGALARIMVDESSAPKGSAGTFSPVV